jgi:hypothetical protein
MCAARPRSGCRAAGTSLLLINGNQSNGKLIWEWGKGAATDLFALGNPVTGSTNYGLCIYGSSGGVPGLALTALIPAAGMCGGEFCWKPSGTKGFSYRDAAGQASGITKVGIHTGTQGEAKVSLKGRGSNLPHIVPANANNLLSQDPLVTVQLVNTMGECWESVFAAPATKVDGTSFRDKF